MEGVGGAEWQENVYNPQFLKRKVRNRKFALGYFYSPAEWVPYWLASVAHLMLIEVAPWYAEAELYLWKYWYLCDKLNVWKCVYILKGRYVLSVVFQWVLRNTYLDAPAFHDVQGRVFQWVDEFILCLLQGQFLLENIVDKERKYEFPLEFEVRFIWLCWILSVVLLQVTWWCEFLQLSPVGVIFLS